MASKTTTIRVSRATHDALSAQARERGVSLAALLTQIADERRRAEIWRTEREASRLDAQSSEAQAEAKEWESTSDDGLD